MLSAFGELAAATPLNWNRLLTIRAEAANTKRSGDPWDPNHVTVMPPSIPILHAGVFFPLTAPAPDLFICVVDEAGQSMCHVKKTNGPDDTLCPNSPDCVFSSIPVPRGWFGVLVGDIDGFAFPGFPRGGANDFVAATVFRDGPNNPARSYAIERQLLKLAAKWDLADRPSEILTLNWQECGGDHPCRPVGSSGWIGIEEQKLEQCGFPMPDIKLEAHLSGKEITVDADISKGSCPGTTEFQWKFGDGTSFLTNAASVDHEYTENARYELAVTPRCRRQFTVCQGPDAKMAIDVNAERSPR